MGWQGRNNGSPFKRAAATVAAHEILDQFGRALHVGDKVIFAQTPGVIYAVQEISSPTDLDPRQSVPAGTKKLVMLAPWIQLVPSGQPLAGLIKVDAAEELAAAIDPASQLVTP